VLATLKVAPSTAAPGATVQVTGTNFSSNQATFTPVQIRLNSRTGPVLKEVVPDATNKINTTVAVPAGTSGGDHLVVATQSNKNTGAPKTGTPGRTVMRVQGAAASSSTPAASPWSNSKPGAPGGSAASVAAGGSGDSPLLPIVLSLALLSIGLTLVGRDRGTRGARSPLLGA